MADFASNTYSPVRGVENEQVTSGFSELTNLPTEGNLPVATTPDTTGDLYPATELDSLSASPEAVLPTQPTPEAESTPAAIPAESTNVAPAQTESSLPADFFQQLESSAQNSDPSHAPELTTAPTISETNNPTPTAAPTENGNATTPSNLEQMMAQMGGGAMGAETAQQMMAGQEQEAARIAQETAAHAQAVAEGVKIERQKKHEQELEEARAEIQRAQQYVHSTGNQKAIDSIDQAVAIFEADRAKGKFNRGIFASITFYETIHRKLAQLEAKKQAEAGGGAVADALTNHETQKQQQATG